MGEPNPSAGPVAPLDAFLAQLRADPEFMRDVTAWQRAPAMPARHAPFPAGLHPRVIEALRWRGVEQPYTHQAEAIARALGGEHVVTVASAAGGKSLCFHAPIADAVARDPRATALCLFPTKALSQDQLGALSALIGRVRDDGPARAVQVYDGDTPQSQRADIRRDARVIITNADMLHLGILPHHTRWAAFLRRLRYVVIDEMHLYRGVFGSHVANVMRRLKRLCAFYGASPVFILASATIANPHEHAERLIESPVALVDDDGSPHGEQHVVVMNPPLLPDAAGLGMRRSSLLVARDVATRFVLSGAQTICFARSRQDTELLLSYLRNQARADTRAGIAGYRGGYLPEERREIESGLRSGRVRAVVTTNALEVGIDIGELDACVMHGYPGTIASFWQQAGRAGRRLNTSAAIMVASANALDQYLAAHPEYLFSQSPEHARIAPDNLGILAAHVACATFELPFMRGETLGRARVDELLDALAEEGDIHASGGVGGLPLFAGGERAEGETPPPATQYTWVGESYPAERINLRGVGDRVTIMAQSEGDAGRILLGETERALAPTRVHVGAVYMHQGDTWLVTELDWEAGVARARRVDSDYYTRASVTSEVVVLQQFEPTTNPASPACGEIQVTSRATRFRQIQFNTHRELGIGEIDLPEQTLLTTGYWFSVPEALAKQLSREGVIKLPNDYGPNWPRQRSAARARDQFRCRVCGKPEAENRQHDVHHKRPFRLFGYVPGENDLYLTANALDNLMTVCPDCHMRIETAERGDSALDRLGYLLGNIAPLFVMCDPGDLMAVADWQSPHTQLPTITLYELTPGGVGLAQELAVHHDAMLRMCEQRIHECMCERGCPACVGPVGEEGEDSRNRHPKKDALRLISMLRAAS